MECGFHSDKIRLGSEIRLVQQQNVSSSNLSSWVSAKLFEQKVYNESHGRSN